MRAFIDKIKILFLIGVPMSSAHASMSLPLVGTDIAAKWDSLYDFLLILSAIFFVIVIGGMIVFAIQYRNKPGRKAKFITHNVPLEIMWTLVPTLLLGVIFVWGYQVYHAMVNAPANAYEIRVIGKQWLWQFQYDDGRTTVGELFVPVNKPVKLIMTSDDVLHSFFIPNFRVKQDVVPGMYTSVWFEAKMPGRHQIYCAEYCGTSHAGMLAQVVALNESDWTSFVRGKKLAAASFPAAGGENAGVAGALAPLAPAGSFAKMTWVEQGKALSESKGCVACHTVDGIAKIGPSYKGLFGSKGEFVDGSTAVKDENYIRTSIENPQAKVLKGFNPIMPTFKGLLSTEEINALVAYIKSLK